MFARLFGGGNKQAAGPSTSGSNNATSATINAMQVRRERVEEEGREARA